MSNLENLRKKGNFQPNQAYNPSNDEKKIKNIEPQKKSEEQKQTNDSADKYIPSVNQRKSLKVSPQTKIELEELKRSLQLGFNYEVIQYLIDNYINTNFSQKEKQRFKENTNL